MVSMLRPRPDRSDLTGDGAGWLRYRTWELLGRHGMAEAEGVEGSVARSSLRGGGDELDKLKI